MKGILSPRFWVVLAAPLFFLSWVIPVRYGPWGSAYQELFSFIAVLVILASMFYRKVRVSYAIVLVFFVAVIPLLQNVFGVVFFFGDALLASAYIASFACMLLVGFNVGADKKLGFFTLRVFAILFVTVATVSAWAAFHQWLLLPLNSWFLPLPAGWRPYGNLSQPNNLATLLCWGLAGLIYLHEKKLVGIVASTVLALFLTSAVAVTQSRTPWVGAILTLACWAWHSRSAVNLSFRPKFFFLWVVVYFVCVFFVVPWFASFYGLAVVDVVKRASSLQRLDIWGQCLYAINSGPWYGYGWTQVSVAQIAVTSQYSVPIMIQYCHNAVLDVLIWNGRFIGSLIVACLCVWLLRLNIFKGRTAEDGFCGLVILFFFIHSLLEYPHAYSFFLLPLGFFIGVLERKRKSSGVVSFPRLLLLFFLISGVAVSTRFWVEYRIVQEDARILRFEVARVGTLQGGGGISDILVFSQLRELLSFARFAPKNGLSQEEVRGMAKVAHRYSNFGSLKKYAEILVLNGQILEGCKEALLIRDIYGLDRYLQVRDEIAAKVVHDLVLKKAIWNAGCFSFGGAIEGLDRG